MRRRIWSTEKIGHWTRAGREIDVIPAVVMDRGRVMRMDIGGK